MLRCQDVSELATDYMEHTLPLRRRLAVRFHLQLCSMCRAYIDQLTKTRQLLGRGRLAPPSPDREQQLITTIPTAPPPPSEPPA